MTDTPTLRALLKDAESKLGIYKSPDINEELARLAPVLVAAGLGSIEHEYVVDITEYGVNLGPGSRYDNHYFEIRTEWSARGCVQTSEYRLPASIVDAGDPLAAAAAWKVEKEYSKLRSDFDTAHRDAERKAHALFSALPVGPERTRMGQVYENVRTATRVPLEG